jgi:hypothetical protein
MLKNCYQGFYRRAGFHRGGAENTEDARAIPHYSPFISFISQFHTLRNFGVLCGSAVSLRRITNLSIGFLSIAFLMATGLESATAQQSASGATVPAQEQKEPSKFKPGSIKGRVIGDDGQPMANIPVVASRIGRSDARRLGPAGQGAQTNTDDDGNFEFEGMVSGSYVISASAPGYITAPPSLAEENSAGVYRVGDVANITLVKGGVITGKVANVAGEVLTGVSVNAIRIGGVDGEDDDPLVVQGFGRNWRTDDRGIYRIYGLVPGAYIVQAGGRGGPGPAPPSPFSQDGPTYYPSSSRDAATPVSVRAGEEVSGIDISYRGEKGRVVSGRVIAKTADGGARFNTTQITLSLPGSDAVVATAMQIDRGQIDRGQIDRGQIDRGQIDRGQANRGPANRGQANRGADRGFAFYGIADGEYEIVARRGGGPGESDAISTARHISVRGTDVGGIELTLSPLASVSGRVVLEKKAAVCEKQRASTVEEVLMSAEREDAQSREPAPGGRWAVRRPSAPFITGEFTLRNLEAGRHRLITQLPDENWYLRAIGIEGKVESKPASPGARRTASPAPINIARNGVTLKAGEKLTGVTVTIAEGAAGLKGQLISNSDGQAGQAGKSAGKIRVYLIPAEKESADDVLRYAQSPSTEAGGFQFKNLAPGRYFLLVKPVKDNEGGKSSGRISGMVQIWDNAQRAALRKDAEAAGNAIELQACHRTTDFKLANPYR